MLGTDYPFPLGEVTGFAGAYPGKTIFETFPDDEKVKSKLLFDNAMQFLNLDPNNYWTEIFDNAMQVLNLDPNSYWTDMCQIRFYNKTQYKIILFIFVNYKICLGN